MPLKDCTLVISYILAFLCVVVFGNAMFSEKWIVVSGDKRRGLWKECWKVINRTDPEEPPDECNHLPMAQGPAFLDTSRTLMCFAFPIFILGWFGYFCFQKEAAKPEHTWSCQLKVRLQEIAYFVAASMATAAVVVYGLFQYDYHTNECGLTGIRFHFGFYGTAVAAGMGLVSSVMMAVSRHTGFRKMVRKKWKSLKLKCKSSKPRVIKMKKEKDLSEVKSDGNSEFVNDAEKKEVQVKSSKLAKYILPIALIQAARRVKMDVYHKLENIKTPDDDKMNNVVRVIPCEGNTDNSKEVVTEKTKDHHQLPPLIKVPPGMERNAVGSAELPITEPIRDNSNFPVAGDTRVVPPLNIAPRDTLPGEATTENQERPGVRRSATTLGKGSEPEWTRFTTQPSPRKPPTPQRTMSHGFPQSPNKSLSTTTPRESSIPESNVDIYTLPSEPGSVQPNFSINYHEVVTGTQDGERAAPQPMITKQSMIFQPYS